MRATIGRLILAGVLLGAPVLCYPVPAMAQVQTLSFRTLDQARLLQESRLGQQVLAVIREAERVLEEENAALAAQLRAEEQALTALRPSLTPEEFRTQADAFEARVEAIRAERNQRGLDLINSSAIEEQRFYDAALPVLDQLMREQGIDALMHPDVMILGPEWLDVTGLAIQRLDAAFEAGQSPQVTPEPTAPVDPTAPQD